MRFEILETCQKCLHRLHDQRCGYVGYTEKWTLRNTDVDPEYLDESDFDVEIIFDQPCQCGVTDVKDLKDE